MKNKSAINENLEIPFPDGPVSSFTRSKCKAAKETLRDTNTEGSLSVSIKQEPLSRSIKQEPLSRSINRNSSLENLNETSGVRDQQSTELQSAELPSCSSTHRSVATKDKSLQKPAQTPRKKKLPSKRNGDRREPYALRSGRNPRTSRQRKRAPAMKKTYSKWSTVSFRPYIRKMWKLKHTLQLSPAVVNIVDEMVNEWSKKILDQMHLMMHLDAPVKKAPITRKDIELASRIILPSKLKTNVCIFVEKAFNDLAKN